MEGGTGCWWSVGRLASAPAFSPLDRTSVSTTCHAILRLWVDGRYYACTLTASFCLAQFLQKAKDVIAGVVVVLHEEMLGIKQQLGSAFRPAEASMASSDAYLLEHTDFNRLGKNGRNF